MIWGVAQFTKNKSDSEIIDNIDLFFASIIGLLKLSCKGLDYLTGCDTGHRYKFENLDVYMTYVGNEDQDGNCEFVLKNRRNGVQIPIYE